MTLTKAQAGLTLASGILAVIGMVTGVTLKFSEKFAALDTRLGKLESAIRTMNVTTPDERYRELVKELIAQERSESIQARKADRLPRFGLAPGSDAGAAADAPAVKVPQ